MVSLCPSFYQDSFHKDEKGQISQEKKFFLELFRPIICHSQFLFFYYLLYSACLLEILLKLIKNQFSII